MDEEVYVRVFPWRSSEARLSQAADGNSQHIGKQSKGGRRERGPRAGVAAFLLDHLASPQKKAAELDTTLSSLQGTSLLCEICIKALFGHESCCGFLNATTPPSVTLAPHGKRDFPRKNFPPVLLGNALTTFSLRLVRQPSLAHSALFKQGGD